MEPEHLPSRQELASGPLECLDNLSRALELWVPAQ